MSRSEGYCYRWLILSIETLHFQLILSNQPNERRQHATVPDQHSNQKSLENSWKYKANRLDCMDRVKIQNHRYRSFSTAGLNQYIYPAAAFKRSDWLP
jgi:hypothetical protein